MKPIEQKLEIMQDICANLGGILQAIQTLRGVAEIEIRHQALTPETCAAISDNMYQAEKAARQLDTGLKSIHQSMAKYLPPDASEGNKNWPPEP